MCIQAADERRWDLDAAASRLVAALLRNDPACRVAVRGLESPSAPAARAEWVSRLSLRGSDTVDDVALQAERMELLIDGSRRPGSDRATRHAPFLCDAAGGVPGSHRTASVSLE